MVSFVSVQGTGVAVDVDSFPDSAVEPIGFLILDLHNVPVDRVLCVLGVLHYMRGGATWSLVHSEAGF